MQLDPIAIELSLNFEDVKLNCGVVTAGQRSHQWQRCRLPRPHWLLSALKGLPGRLWLPGLTDKRETRTQQLPRSLSVHPGLMMQPHLSCSYEDIQMEPSSNGSTKVL